MIARFVFFAFISTSLLLGCGDTRNPSETSSSDFDWERVDISIGDKLTSSNGLTGTVGLGVISDSTGRRSLLTCWSSTEMAPPGHGAIAVSMYDNNRREVARSLNTQTFGNINQDVDYLMLGVRSAIPNEQIGVWPQTIGVDGESITAGYNHRSVSREDEGALVYFLGASTPGILRVAELVTARASASVEYGGSVGTIPADGFFIKSTGRGTRHVPSPNPIISDGDCGSAVFDSDGRILGLIRARLKNESDTALVTPITSIFGYDSNLKIVPRFISGFSGVED